MITAFCGHKHSPTSQTKTAGKTGIDDSLDRGWWIKFDGCCSIRIPGLVPLMTLPRTFERSDVAKPCLLLPFSGGSWDGTYCEPDRMSHMSTLPVHETA